MVLRELGVLTALSGRKGKVYQSLLKGGGRHSKQGEALELMSYFKQRCSRGPKSRDLQSVTGKNKTQED